MEQLDVGLKNSIVGPLREQIVLDSKKQFQEWSLPLPKVEPLVMDFGLHDFYKEGLVEYWIINDQAAGHCAKYMFLFEGQSCPRHRHRKKRETFFLLKGSVQVEYGGNILEMRPGDVLDIELWTYHMFTGRESSVILEISQPCIIDDNHFENTKITLGSNFNK